MDKTTALVCAKLSQAVYRHKYKKIPEFEFSGTFHEEETDTEGAYGVVDKTTIVVFRGTEPLEIMDWLTDIDANQQVLPYEKSHSNSAVRVHQGFLKAYISVRDVVLGIARAENHGRIICTGHSLGAALATLAALDVQYNVPEKAVECYT